MLHFNYVSVSLVDLNVFNFWQNFLQRKKSGGHYSPVSFGYFFRLKMQIRMFCLFVWFHIVPSQAYQIAWRYSINGLQRFENSKLIESISLWILKKLTFNSYINWFCNKFDLFEWLNKSPKFIFNLNSTRWMKIHWHIFFVVFSIKYFLKHRNPLNLPDPLSPNFKPFLIRYLIA